MKPHALLLALALLCAPAFADLKRPNILFLFSDDGTENSKHPLFRWVTARLLHLFKTQLADMGYDGAQAKDMFLEAAKSARLSAKIMAMSCDETAKVFRPITVQIAH